MMPRVPPNGNCTFTQMSRTSSPMAKEAMKKPKPAVRSSGMMKAAPTMAAVIPAMGTTTPKGSPACLAISAAP